MAIVLLCLAQIFVKELAASAAMEKSARKKEKSCEITTVLATESSLFVTYISKNNMIYNRIWTTLSHLLPRTLIKDIPSCPISTAIWARDRGF